MATVYAFGGARQNDGRPHPINQNDRQFRCGFGVCEAVTPTARPVPQQDLFNLDFELFDIDELRANLRRVSDEVAMAYKNMLNWFLDLERNVAIKVQTGDIEMNITLFNKLNLIIPKFSMARKVVDSWYADYIDMVTDLSDLFSEYSNSSTKLQSLSTQNTVIGGIRENVITLARQNISKSKSIQRAITKILSIDARIRSALQALTFKMNELTSGTLRYGSKNERKILNLTELSNAVMSLGEGDSPLVKIQTQLSSVINSTPLNFTLRTRPPELLPNVNYDPKNTFANDLSSETVLEKLYAFRDTTLYTTTTKPAVDALQDYVEHKFRDDLQYNNMLAIIERIRVQNVPNRFLDTLQMNASNPENIYLTIDVIKQVINKLSDQDTIYRERLDQILQTAMNTATNIVEQGDVDMEL
nr:TPA: hypothetical protein [Oryctes rhinoceros nudivirus]